MRNYQKSLLDLTQITILLIDHEPQIFFGVESTCRKQQRSSSDCNPENDSGWCKARTPEWQRQSLYYQHVPP
uniref:hypothetical protein n=1 Tax=Clostridium sp. NkU-1 TaxID=1095009 RepID=UPI000AE15042